MKKSVVLLSIAIVVVGMLAGLKIFVSENPDFYDEDQTVGKALAQMERETDRRVENLYKEIESGSLAEADCRMQIRELAEDILYNLSHLEEEEGSWLNLAYSCSVIRKLGLRGHGGDGISEVGLKLRRDNLSLFSDEVFSYVLDFTRNTQEKADYAKLSDWAEEIEADLDQEVERYTRRMYAWYGGK